LPHSLEAKNGRYLNHGLNVIGTVEEGKAA